MKKVMLSLLTLIFILSIFVTLVHAQGTPIRPLGIDTEKLANTTEKVKTEAEKWQTTNFTYLQEEWRKRLLESEFISKIDSFFQKISIVFLVFFGEHYSLKLSLLLIILLWFYSLFLFYGIFKYYSAFSEGVSYVISFGMVVMMAHFKILRKIIDGFGWLVFSKEGTIWRTLIITGIIVILIAVYMFTSKFGKEYKKKKEKEKEELDRQRLGTGARIAEEITEAVAGEGG